MRGFGPGELDEDGALVAACRKGDAVSFEKIVLKYQKKMFNIAYRITGSYEDAAEAAQDAFLNAFRNMGSFEGTARFSTWLTAIVVNCARNRIRQMAAAHQGRTCPIGDRTDGDGRVFELDPPADELPALDRLEKEEAGEKVQGCIETLESGFREVLVLRDFQELSYEEIGSALGIVEGTVKSRLYRAREAVRECLKRVLGMS